MAKAFPETLGREGDRSGAVTRSIVAPRARRATTAASEAEAGYGPYQRQRIALLAGLLPALLLLAALTLAPALYLFVISLTPGTPTNPASLTDVSAPAQNYVSALGDERFTQSLWVQLELSASTVVAQTALGLGVALLLNRRGRLVRALRTVFLVPTVLPPIVAALIWKVFYTPDVSPMHRALAALGLPVSSLITNPDTALWAIALADTWQWFPFTMLIILAALQVIPREPLEAAKVDGAGPWQLFRHVVLPFIRPAIVVAALFRLIDSVKAFPLIYVLTSGGPGTATQVTNYYAFTQAFNYAYWGYASAIAVMLTAAVFVLSWVISRRGAAAAADA
jgi:multiple sugar transport system permease protein